MLWKRVLWSQLKSFSIPFEQVRIFFYCEKKLITRNKIGDTHPNHKNKPNMLFISNTSRDHWKVDEKIYETLSQGPIKNL